jgi:hypothetical protein
MVTSGLGVGHMAFKGLKAPYETPMKERPHETHE